MPEEMTKMKHIDKANANIILNEDRREGWFEIDMLTVLPDF
ncbi:MAG: hypothetical protein Tsb009_32820 [Planctomycetaceae bacterium]